MKKIVLTLMALMSLTLTYAENDNAASKLNAEAYDMTVNMRKLAVTLGMTIEQMEIVEDIHRNFCNEMMQAAEADENERGELVDKAVKKDIRYMNYVLNDSQQRKYEMLLNATLQNRGLK